MRYFTNGEIVHGALDEIQASAFINAGYSEVEKKESPSEAPVSDKAPKKVSKTRVKK